MRKFKFGILAAVSAVAAYAPAIHFVQTNQFNVGTGAVLTDETWVSAQIIRISGTVSNDFFATAPDIQLNGTFENDTWVMGDTVRADGMFNNDLRMAAAGSVQVAGTVHGTLAAAGSAVQINPTANIYGDVVCFGQSVTSEGVLHGPVKITANKVTLGGQFAGDVSVTAQDIVVLPETILNGDLNYMAPKELVLSSSVLLNGKLNRKFAPVPASKFFKEDLVGHFGFAAAALLAGLAFFSAFPLYTTRAAGLLQTARGTCALSGFAGLVLIPLIAFLLLITFIGLPLSLLISGFYLILLYLSKIVVGLWIGATVLRKKELSRKNIFGTLALGLILIYAMTSIAAVSLAVQLVIIIFGLGALLLALVKKPVVVMRPPETVEQKTEE